MENDESNCNYNVTGINAQFGYNAQNNSCDKKYKKNELLKEIQQLFFAITELALYLNTHPTDEKALCLHKEYSNKLEKLKEIYQNAFGPLTIYHPGDKWKWLSNPWPWERSEM